MFRKSLLVLSSVAALGCGGLWVAAMTHPFAIVRYRNVSVGYQYLIASNLHLSPAGTFQVNALAIARSPLPTDKIVFLDQLSVEHGDWHQAGGKRFEQAFPREEFYREASDATLRVEVKDISWVIVGLKGGVGFMQYNRTTPWTYRGSASLARTPVWPFAVVFAFPPLLAFVRGPLRRFRRRKRGACTACGYNLTGNVSGVCPECGTAAPPNSGVSHLANPISRVACPSRRHGHVESTEQ